MIAQFNHRLIALNEKRKILKTNDKILPHKIPQISSLMINKMAKDNHGYNIQPQKQQQNRIFFYSFVKNIWFGFGFDIWKNCKKLTIWHVVSFKLHFMRMYIAFQVFSLSLCKINKENRKYVYETPEKNIRSTCIKQMSCITTVNYVWRKKNFRQSFYRICVSLSNGLALIRDEQIRREKIGIGGKKKA